MTRPAVKQLDVVALTHRVGQWPAGRVGTVVESHQSAALVEISVKRGRALDFITVPFDTLRPASEAD